MPSLLALVIVVAGLGPAELPEYAPAGDSAYTLDLELDGYRNGEMDPDRLLKIGSCTLERDAAYTYSLMKEAAEEDDIYLRTEGCYRTLRKQEAAYERRCPFRTVATYTTDPYGAVVKTGTKKARVCTGPPTAYPGTSNHGWGRAIDFKDNRNILTCYDKEFLWLKNNAHRFGWVHPQWARCGQDTQEPWHWEYAGVTDPSLVKYTTINPALVATAE
jgi:LAS superfamily LD-carboxypeptidase LdcB